MILGFKALPGSGKDTAAEYLKENFGFKHIAFSDTLYKEISEHYNVPVDILKDRKYKDNNENLIPELKGKTPRTIAQEWGDHRRKQDQCYFIRRVLQILSEDKNSSFVVSDLRFTNEIELIKSLGGYTVGIKTFGFPDILDNNAKKHISETQTKDYIPDYFVRNVKGNYKILFNDLDELLLLCS
jgi:hypothetical protein